MCKSKNLKLIEVILYALIGNIAFVTYSDVKKTFAA